MKIMTAMTVMANLIGEISTEAEQWKVKICATKDMVAVRVPDLRAAQAHAEEVLSMVLREAAAEEAVLLHAEEDTGEINMEAAQQDVLQEEEVLQEAVPGRK